MSENPDFKRNELASIVEQYLPSSATNDSNDITANFGSRSDWYAVYINRVRSLGAGNFFLVEADRQISDIRHDLRRTIKAIEGLGRYAEFISIASDFASLTRDSQSADIPELTDFIGIREIKKQLELALMAINWHERNVRNPSWKLANKRNWTIPSVALACRHVYAMEHIATESEKWRDFLRQNPEQDDASHVRRFYETAAPKSANRDLPSKFGRFIEAVLNFYGERGREGEKVSAAVALRALRNILEKP